MIHQGKPPEIQNPPSAVSTAANTLGAEGLVSPREPEGEPDSPGSNGSVASPAGSALLEESPLDEVSGGGSSVGDPNVVEKLSKFVDRGEDEEKIAALKRKISDIMEEMKEAIKPFLQNEHGPYKFDPEGSLFESAKESVEEYFEQCEQDRVTPNKEGLEALTNDAVQGFQKIAIGNTHVQKAKMALYILYYHESKAAALFGIKNIKTFFNNILDKVYTRRQNSESAIQEALNSIKAANQDRNEDRTEDRTEILKSILYVRRLYNDYVLIPIHDQQDALVSDIEAFFKTKYNEYCSTLPTDEAKPTAQANPTDKELSVIMHKLNDCKSFILNEVRKKKSGINIREIKRQIDYLVQCSKCTDRIPDYAKDIAGQIAQGLGNALKGQVVPQSYRTFVEQMQSWCQSVANGEDITETAKVAGMTYQHMLQLIGSTRDRMMDITAPVLGDRRQIPRIYQQIKEIRDAVDNLRKGFEEVIRRGTGALDSNIADFLEGYMDKPIQFFINNKSAIIKTLYDDTEKQFEVLMEEYQSISDRYKSLDEGVDKIPDSDIKADIAKQLENLALSCNNMLEIQRTSIRALHDSMENRTLSVMVKIAQCESNILKLGGDIVQWAERGGQGPALLASLQSFIKYARGDAEINLGDRWSNSSSTEQIKGVMKRVIQLSCRDVAGQIIAKLKAVRNSLDDKGGQAEDAEKQKLILDIETAIQELSPIQQGNPKLSSTQNVERALHSGRTNVQRQSTCQYKGGGSEVELVMVGGSDGTGSRMYAGMGHVAEKVTLSDRGRGGPPPAPRLMSREVPSNTGTDQGAKKQGMILAPPSDPGTDRTGSVTQI